MKLIKVRVNYIYKNKVCVCRSGNGVGSASSREGSERWRVHCHLLRDGQRWVLPVGRKQWYIHTQVCVCHNVFIRLCVHEGKWNVCSCSHKSGPSQTRLKPEDSARITNVPATGKMQTERTAASITPTSTPAPWDTWYKLSSENIVENNAFDSHCDVIICSLYLRSYLVLLLLEEIVRYLSI